MTARATSVEARRSVCHRNMTAIAEEARRHLDRAVQEIAWQLPKLVSGASADELRQFLPGFLEEKWIGWQERESHEVAQALQALAKTMVPDADGAVDGTARGCSESVRGNVHVDINATGLGVDTMGYDVGVAAVFGIGLGAVFTSLGLGVALTGLASALAVLFKGRVDSQTRQKACLHAEVALRAAAVPMASHLDDMIWRFASRLDAYLEVAESDRVLSDCDDHGRALAELQKAFEGLSSHEILA